MPGEACRRTSNGRRRYNHDHRQYKHSRGLNRIECQSPCLHGSDSVLKCTPDSHGTIVRSCRMIEPRLSAAKTDCAARQDVEMHGEMFLVTIIRTSPLVECLYA